MFGKYVVSRRLAFFRPPIEIRACLVFFLTLLLKTIRAIRTEEIMKKITSIGVSLALAAASLVGFAAPANATSFEGRYYAATNNGTGSESLYEFDPLTNTLGSQPISTFAATNEITSLEVDGTNGIAYLATYGWSNSVTTQFWTIDLASGIATLVNADNSTVAGANDSNFQDFALDPVTGNLYARSETGNKLYTVDKATGLVTNTVTMTGDSNLLQGAGLAISASQEYLVSSSMNGASPNKYSKLAVLNPLAATSMVVGRTAFNPSTSLSIGLQSIDYAPDGSLVLWSTANNTPARFGSISASALSALDLVGSSNVSSTATTSVVTTSSTLTPGLGYTLAVANVAPALQRTITYNANSGTGSQSSTVGAGSVTVANGASLTRSGYTLSGWNTAANGTGTAIALSGSYTVTADVTLYAQWTAASGSAAYSGPVFNPFTNRFVDSVKGAKLALTGRRLDAIKSITVAGKPVKVNLVSDQKLELELPAGVDGAAELSIVTESGSITWHNAFTYQNPKFAKVTDYVAPKVVKKKPKAKR
jgi:uncharacterized repeat protein (TIGR02543 family)